MPSWQLLEFFFRSKVSKSLHPFSSLRYEKCLFDNRSQIMLPLNVSRCACIHYDMCHPVRKAHILGPHKFIVCKTITRLTFGEHASFHVHRVSVYQRRRVVYTLLRHIDGIDHAHRGFQYPGASGRAFYPPKLTRFSHGKATHAIETDVYRLKLMFTDGNLLASVQIQQRGIRFYSI